MLLEVGTELAVLVIGVVLVLRSAPRPVGPSCGALKFTTPTSRVLLGELFTLDEFSAGETLTLLAYSESNVGDLVIVDGVAEKVLPEPAIDLLLRVGFRGAFFCFTSASASSSDIVGL